MSYGSSIFGLSRNFHIVSYSDCISLHSHQRSVWAISVPSVQFYCETKNLINYFPVTSANKTMYLKNNFKA